VAALATLRAELDAYNRSLIPDQIFACDNRSCPSNFNPPGERKSSGRIAPAYLLCAL
jgi:hypothetical protein